MPPASDASRSTHIQRRYLQVEELRRLKHLVFSANRVVEGQYSGLHASPQRGHSVEFSDYREYTPGDEISGIDWKVYGRSDKLFIKLFEHQSDMTVNLLIDASASMNYSGELDAQDRAAKSARTTTGWRARLRRRRRGFGGSNFERSTERDGTRSPIETPSKYDHACLMAAAIAFLVVKNQDKVGFGVAQGGLQEFHRPLGSHTHLNQILQSMETVRPEGAASLADSIEAYAARVRRKSILLLFSDLLDGREDILRALSLFTHGGGEVIVFQVLHADELKLPDLSEAVFVDSETRWKTRLNVDDLRSHYEQRLAEFLAAWSAAFRARGIDYNLVSTSKSYHQAIEHYLFSRASKR